MKARSFMFAALFVSVMLLVANLGDKVNLKANATPLPAQSNSPTGLPSFLEKGKVYAFTFVASMGSTYGTNPITIVGRIEKLDTNSGWVYINHHVTTRKGKALESKFEGYSWININQAFQCSEMTVIP